MWEEVELGYKDFKDCRVAQQTQTQFLNLNKILLQLKGIANGKKEKQQHK